MARVYHVRDFRFRDQDDLPGVVDLQIFQRSDGKMVVVVSELVDASGNAASRGVSVTDGIEQIATLVVNELGFRIDYLIEHFPAHGPVMDLARVQVEQRESREKFYLLTLRWDDAQREFRVDQAGEKWAWQQISRHAAENIVGEPFHLKPSSGSMSP